jgi:hypothetical protein
VKQVAALQICRPPKRTFVFNMNREPGPTSRGWAIFIRPLTRTGALPDGRATAPFVSLNQSFVTCDAALPSDVRKGYAFPTEALYFSGLCPESGA